MTDDARTIEALLSELVMLRGRVAELEAREAIPHTSEKKRDEEALREYEEKYRVVVQQAHEGILVAQDGVHRFVNPAAAKIWGYSEAELISRPVAEFIHPDDREMVLNRQLRRAKGENLPGRYPFRIVTKDGTFKWAEIDSASISWEGKPAVLVFMIDVTERKQMEEAIKERDDHYRALVEESFDGIMIAKGTKIVFVNSRLCQMLGYAKDELEGMEHRMLAHPDCQDLVLQRALARMRGENVPPHYELKFQRKDGSIFDAEIHSLAIEIRGAPGVQVWIRDITGRKEAEKELEQLTNQLTQAQKMEAIGTLTGGIAHDFNNLLTIMNGFTELALSEKTEDDPSYSDLHKVLETGRKGAELVQRLLAFSRKAEISLSPLDLNNIVENVIDLVGRTFPKMIEIEAILAKDLSMINADAMQIEQALMNLCINAKEAMPEGGQLKIETRNVAVDMDYCRLTSGARPGLFVLFEVADSGRGMDAEIMARMFDPFFTTKGWDFKKGTGLGLSVAKGIVEQHGGLITCQSEPGKGSTFRVYFPLINNSPVFHNSEPLAKGVSGGEKILVVDDEVYVRDLGRSILERSGYTVTTAANGKEALEIYAREQSNIALVVLDLMMPQMGGEKCLEELLKINPQVRVIVSTGHSLDPKEVGHLGVHAKGLVNKPYQMKQFMEVVREVLATS
jgi:two-component system, cell cycle sensor histidine kinase and response regulator CckA